MTLSLMFAMEDGQNNLEQLAANPSESLSVELKEWIDPNALEGIEKIVKACLAL